MADIAELIVALKLQDGVSSGLGRLNGQLQGMSGGLSQVGRGIGQIGRGFDQIATRGAIAAAAGLTAVVSAAVSFEDAFAGVRKTVDATESEFGILEDRLRGMARTMPVSFEELAGIAEAGGALGIAFEGLDEFTKVVADLAATTDLSADQAATSLGVLGNVLNLQAEDFDNFGSALVDLGNKGASTETQILSIAERIGATGSLIGLTSDQVLGFGAAVANVGIEAEAGGSALQRFFIDALTAVESGGEDLETFARTAGQTAGAFRDSFRKDAGAALADFIAGLGELPEAVQIETLQDLGFNDVRITRTLLGLAGDVDNLTDSLNISAQAFAENSALGVEAAKRYGTVASQLQILKQNVTDAAVTIGEELLPIVADLTSEFVGFLNQPGTQAGIKEFAQNLAGGIRDLVREIKGADFGPLIDTMKGAAAIAKGAFDAFRGLPQPLQQLALAAIVANKVTGGAVGSIASGIGNIFAGLLKIKFLDRGSIGNPMYVVPIGGGLGGSPTGPAGPAGRVGSAALGIAKFVLGPVAAAIIGSEIAAAINEQVIGPEREGEKEEVKAVLEGSNVRDMVTTLASIDSQLNTDDLLAQVGLIGSRIPFIQDALGHIAPTFEAQSRELIAALEKEGLTREQIDKLVRIAQDEPAQFEAALRAVLGPGLRETKITVAPGIAPLEVTLGDKLDKLATNDVIQHLERTNEIGQKGIGTTFQVGIKDGLDPVGDTATRILLRAENPKDPAVMTEIKGHLAGLEEIQATYLNQGDVKLAQKVQLNIDALHAIQGSTDLTRQVTQYLADQAVSSDAAMLQTARTQAAKLDTANARLSAIENKSWTPTVNLTNNINLSPTVIQQKIVQTAILGGIAGGNTIR